MTTINLKEFKDKLKVFKSLLGKFGTIQITVENDECMLLGIGDGITVRSYIEDFETINGIKVCFDLYSALDITNILEGSHFILSEDSEKIFISEIKGNSYSLDIREQAFQEFLIPDIKAVLPIDFLPCLKRSLITCGGRENINEALRNVILKYTDNDDCFVISTNGKVFSELLAEAVVSDYANVFHIPCDIAEYIVSSNVAFEKIGFHTETKVNYIKNDEYEIMFAEAYKKFDKLDFEMITKTDGNTFYTIFHTDLWYDVFNKLYVLYYKKDKRKNSNVYISIENETVVFSNDDNKEVMRKKMFDKSIAPENFKLKFHDFYKLLKEYKSEKFTVYSLGGRLVFKNNDILLCIAKIK